MSLSRILQNCNLILTLFFVCGLITPAIEKVTLGKPGDAKLPVLKTRTAGLLKWQTGKFKLDFSEAGFLFRV